MSKPLHIATSPLTNTIYCGSVDKAGTGWLSNKTDVTGAACGAVAEHVLAFGKPVEVSVNGKPAFEITVKRIGEQS